MKQCGNTFQRIKEFSFILQTNFIPLIKKIFNLQNNEFIYSLTHFLYILSKFYK